jgi:peptide/nickel transport system ATP-binding protein
VSLVVDDLRVYYRSLKGDVRALDGVTFSIGDGEILGLAGESGCGKSTLAKSLVRLDARMRYVAGHVKLDDAELPIWDDLKMNRFRFEGVSIVPQYAMSALNPTRKVGDVAEDLLATRGVAYKQILPELKRRLDLVGLSHDVLGMFPIELSGGMKQRAVMVISTLLDPSLLIADEVTSALDVSSQRALAGMLLEFRERGFVKSMIVVTHDLAVLYQVADTIMVMYAGRLAEKAPAQTIVERPKHPYTQALIGSLPRVGVRMEEQRLQGIPGGPPSLLDPPSGCRFRGRCPLAHGRCAEQPPLVEVESGHHVACWAVGS